MPHARGRAVGLGFGKEVREGVGHFCYEKIRI
jgi:hypothetical protein